MVLYKQFPEGLITNFYLGLHVPNERARRRDVVVYIATTSGTIIRHNVAVMLGSAA
jgi:hypothetical protein